MKMTKKEEKILKSMTKNVGKWIATNDDISEIFAIGNSLAEVERKARKKKGVKKPVVFQIPRAVSHLLFLS